MRNEGICPYKDLNMNARSSFIWNNLKLDTTQTSINRCLNEQIELYTCNGTLHSNKKKWTIDIHNKTDESQARAGTMVFEPVTKRTQKCACSQSRGQESRAQRTEQGYILAVVKLLHRLHKKPLFLWRNSRMRLKELQTWNKCPWDRAWLCHLLGVWSFWGPVFSSKKGVIIPSSKVCCKD